MATLICRDFASGHCSRTHCKFPHKEVCRYFWNGNCKHGDQCKHVHEKPKQKLQGGRRPKNTECFDPMDRPVDMRVTFDLGTDKLTTEIASRDVLIVPNLFPEKDLYDKLVHEIESCGVPQEDLLKPWHGDNHLIVDDHKPWKKNAPTFAMVVQRIRDFFSMDIKATRLNWYKDTSNWKPFHHDASAVKEEKAKTQNFTVAVSFGATRDAAFEEVKSKTVVSMPQPNGTIYAFAKDTNVLWKHGILKEPETREEGRISIICWGWCDHQRGV
jgi:hypothetical protein